MIEPALSAAASTPVQTAGAVLLLVDMILCAILFAYWDRAAAIRPGRRRR